MITEMIAIVFNMVAIGACAFVAGYIYNAGFEYDGKERNMILMIGFTIVNMVSIVCNVLIIAGYT